MRTLSAPDQYWRVRYVKTIVPEVEHYVSIWGHCDKCVKSTFHLLYPKEHYTATLITEA